ncbi:hypothetical protein LCGC14_0620650 [marine sediment metagenome]|uniref:Uncharacterized protein n=1 Tax=marine sediment metagenome TaxID=412755 RepID=A0A0F9RP90_9ZZZZ
MSDNLEAHLLRKKSKAMDAFIAEFGTLIDGYDCGDGDYINDQWYKLKTQHLGSDKKVLEPVMYVFTMNGDFDALLEMSFEDAERYAMQHMAACGEEPNYRTAYGTAPEYHTVDYGTDNKRHIPSARHSISTLRIVEPRTSLKSNRSWDYTENRGEFAEWEKFTQEAKELSIKANGGDYYQWPWPIPEEEDQS